MKMVKIYTDGACSGNPGPGGWGAVLIYNEFEKKISGFDESTTNNRMELISVIESLKLLKEKCIVEIFSDSKYVCDGISKWMLNWKNNNWKGSNKKLIKNDDLWKSLDFELSKHNVNINWIKGHNGDFYNEIADKLARDAIKGKLYAPY